MLPTLKPNHSGFLSRLLAGGLLYLPFTYAGPAANTGPTYQTSQVTGTVDLHALHGSIQSALTESFLSTHAHQTIICLLIGFVVLSIFGWRERLGNRKVKEDEKQLARKATDIDLVAKKLQRRLPENRVMRDRISENGPRMRSKPAEMPATSPFKLTRNANQPKVLVIDESRELRTSLGNQLGRYYSTLESKDLNEALRIVRIARPALIILGMQSNKHDAMAFCRKLKSDSTLWHIPILVLIAKKANADAMQLIKATDDHLITPLQPEELLVAVENLVDVRGYLKQGGLKRPEIRGEDSTTQISDSIFLETVHTVVEDNLSNSLFGLELLAQEVNVSVRQLHGRIRQMTRLSPAGFIRTKRLKQASQLLATGKYNVQEVSRMVGFHSPEYFHRVFKQAFGVPPSEYNISD